MKNTRLYPSVQVDTAPVSAVAQAGGVTLTETIAATGLDVALSRELAGWRRPLATHDPAKIVLDLALTVAMGGRWLADIDIARSEPEIYGRVASDPTVSRLVDALAAAAPSVLKAIDRARAAARARAWALAGKHAPDHGATAKDPLVIDLDATLVTSHSEKEQAMRTWKKGYGFHPLAAFVDHGVEAPGSRWCYTCAAATPDRTPRSTTSRSAARRSPNSQATGPETVPIVDRAGGCWSLPTVPVPPTTS